MTDREIFELVNQIEFLLATAKDGQGAAVALGYLIGLTVARNGKDLDGAMEWLHGVAADAHAEHRAGRIREKHLPLNVASTDRVSERYTN
jgi:hypothetical protein